jgi:hypothetical protein
MPDTGEKHSKMIIRNSFKEWEIDPERSKFSVKGIFLLLEMVKHFFLHLFICAYIVGAIRTSLPPAPILLPQPPHRNGET